METSRNKLKTLLMSWPEGAVLTTSWLNGQGYSNQLLRKYKLSGWIESLGTGAVIRAGTTASLDGAMYALQQQLGLRVHYGGKTSLAILGRLHYLQIGGGASISVFCSRTDKLPSWFLNNIWDQELNVCTKKLFHDDAIGLVSHSTGTFTISISAQERAMMELLHIAQTDDDLYECYELMEGFRTLRSKTVQSLLENCTSIKVKRLFLFFAEQAGHAWMAGVDKTRIGLGTGKRVFTQGEHVYVSRYLMSVPTTLSADNASNIQESGQ